MPRYSFNPKMYFWRRRISRLRKDLVQLKPRQKFIGVVLAIITFVLIRNFWLTENVPRLQRVRHRFLVNQPGCKIPNFGVSPTSEYLNSPECPYQGCDAYTKIVTVYNRTRTITVRRTKSADGCFEETQCCAVAYSMSTKNNDPIRYPERSCYQIKPWQEIKPSIYTEVLEVTCHDLCDNRKIVNFHPLLPLVPKVENKIRAWTRSEYRRAFIRVIVLSIDNLNQDEAQLHSQSVLKREKSKRVLTTGDFIAQPTDYFIPAAFINDNMRQDQVDPQFYNSFASTSPTDFILDFTQKFIRKFTNFPFLSVSRINPTKETMVQLDSKLLQFFLKVSQVQNAVIIFFSNVDSATKVPPSRPFLYTYVPKWIPEGQKRNLFVNSQRLVTPFDVHQTLHEVLIKSCIATGSTMKECLFLSQSDTSQNNGLSVLGPSNKSRNCQDAQIPATLCPCLSSIQN
ncbi:unnamed protein product [Allacma fusca]|uniref:Uncharacterized protein n=1 Tax=Allacma fusca TaxID=39272 RepID=A0A8J2P5B5_9HEXA|nr:unnamed protein product [Allacma fusca]